MRLGQIAALIAIDLGALEPIPRDVAHQLFSEGLVHEHASTDDPYSVSERGRAFLDHLGRLPLPRQVWMMPSADGALDFATLGSAVQFKPLDLTIEDDAPPPPPPKPKRYIPTDPEELRSEATRLMNMGFGMNEVKEQLELTEEQAQAFFFGK